MTYMVSISHCEVGIKFVLVVLFLSFVGYLGMPSITKRNMIKVSDKELMSSAKKLLTDAMKQSATTIVGAKEC